MPHFITDTYKMKLVILSYSKFFAVFCILVVVFSMTYYTRRKNNQMITSWEDQIHRGLPIESGKVSYVSKWI